MPSDVQMPSPTEVVSRIAFGAWTTQALYAAAWLNLADRLAEGPRSPAALAAATGTRERPLYRVLRALAGAGVFAEQADGTFVNTPASEMLRTGVPGSLRDFVVFVGRPWHLAVFGEILHSLETGLPSVDKVVGTNLWDFFARHPEESRIFNAAMTGIVSETAHAVRDAYDFSTVRTLVDVGGGHGYLLGTVLAATPALRGVLLDLPHVAAGAAATFERLGVADRATVVGGDFFREVPAADAYVLSHIVHDWDDERSAALLRTIRRAAAPGARLLLVETVIPPGNEYSYGKVLDLEMLVLPGGVERTEAEYRDLLAVSGFRLERVLATRSPAQIIEGRSV